MAGFTTAAAVSAGLSLAGSATKAAGQYKGGQATSASDYYKAAVANNLATGYREAGTRAVQGGEVGADIAGLTTAENVGKAKAQQGANNIDIGSPTATSVRAGIDQAGRLNQLTVLSNAQLQNWGYQLKAQQEEDQGKLDMAEGSTATSAGAAGAAGSLFSAASALPFSWLSGGGDNSTPPAQQTGGLS